jgi:hypothetical protein
METMKQAVTDGQIATILDGSYPGTDAKRLGMGSAGSSKQDTRHLSQHILRIRPANFRCIG